MFTINESNAKQLKEKRNQYLFNYQTQLEILENLKLLKKKDGTDFANPQKMFDIETLKKHFSKKGYKMGCGSCLYLVESDYDYQIKYSLNNQQGTLYIKKRVYVDELTQEERKQKEHKTIKECSWTRAYYNNTTTEEIRTVIESLKVSIKTHIEAEKLAIKQIDKLIKITAKYIEQVNQATQNQFRLTKSSFYRDEIASLIGY